MYSRRQVLTGHDQESVFGFKGGLVLRKVQVISLFLGLSLSSDVWPQIDARDLYQKSRDSVVLVVALDEANQGISIGTGFFVGDGRKIITNLHVVQGARSLQIKTNAGEVVGASEVLAYDDARDLVILVPDKLGPPLRISSRVPDVGEEVVAIGNPKGLEGTLSQGLISGIREEDELTYYQITAPISPGSSGGPVLDSRGEVLGIATFQYSEGQNLNFAVPASAIEDLLEAPNPIALSSLPSKNKSPQSSDPTVLIRSTADSVFLIDPDLTICVTTGVDSSLYADNTETAAEELLREMRRPVTSNCGGNAYSLSIHSIQHESAVRADQVYKHVDPLMVYGEKFYAIGGQPGSSLAGIRVDLFDHQGSITSKHGRSPIVWSGVVIGSAEIIREFKTEALYEILQHFGNDFSGAVTLTKRPIDEPITSFSAKGEELDFYPQSGVRINEMKSSGRMRDGGPFYYKSRRIKTRTFDGYIEVVGFKPYTILGPTDELAFSPFMLNAFSVVDNEWYGLDYSIGSERDLDQRDAVKLFTLPLTIGQEVSYTVIGSSKMYLRVEQKENVKTPYKKFEDCFVISATVFDGVKKLDPQLTWWCNGAGMVKVQDSEGGTEVLTNVIFE
jgi:hypothetical protein